MLPISLVRHPLRFYLIQAFTFLFISILGSFITWQSAEAINNPEVKRSNYLMLAIGIGLVFIAFYMVTKYFKNTPLIIADGSTIKFGTREIYDLNNVRDIQLTGKIPFPMLLDFLMEGTAIHFKDGAKKVFYDDLYTNAWQLKSFLEQVVVNKKPYELPVTTQINVESRDLTPMEVFKGNPVFSLRGLMLWGLIGFMIVLAFKSARPADPKAIIFYVVISVFWFAAISNCMHYFGITANYLIIKNHNYFWKRHFYNLSDIKEIVFETQARAPHSLRLIAKDFRTKRYPAGTLGDNHWLELMDKLKEKGIVVRNEIAIPNSA